MAKILFLLLFSFAAQAFDLQARRNGEGYAFRFIQDGVIYCWGMPDLADLNYFSQTWMKVTDTALAYSWPLGDAAFAAVCAENLNVKRTNGSFPMWSITPNLTVVETMQLPAGIPCGEQAGQWEFIRAITYNGRSGITLCF